MLQKNFLNCNKRQFNSILAKQKLRKMTMKRKKIAPFLGSKTPNKDLELRPS